jgi:hypothetical protein
LEDNDKEAAKTLGWDKTSWDEKYEGKYRPKYLVNPHTLSYSSFNMMPSFYQTLPGGNCPNMFRERLVSSDGVKISGTMKRMARDGRVGRRNGLIFLLRRRDVRTCWAITNTLGGDFLVSKQCNCFKTFLVRKFAGGCPPRYFK